MNKGITGLFAAAAVALVVTAFGLHPQVAQPINAIASGGAHLEEASLGYRVA